jgi:hypothetical protein
MSQKFKSEVQLEALNNATTDTDKFLVSDGGIIKYRTGAQVLSDLGASALYVPYTGATGNVDLGANTLLAKDLIINHSSGSGVAASITKNGSGEALTVIKGSGSGNAMSVTGGLTSLVDLTLSSIPNATIDTDRFLVSDSGAIKYRTGAEVLSDIGGQSALTNPVTGTGTTNYVPKFTGATTLGDSLIYDNGTNVGIGTTNPLQKLHVFGPIASGNTTEGVMLTSAAGVGRVLGVDAGFNGWNDLDIRATSATQLYLNTSGNVGIGINTLTEKLVVAGNVFLNSLNATLELGNGGGGKYGSIAFNNSTNDVEIKQKYVAGGIVFSTNTSSERMRITSSGNVGIGTTSPGDLLTVNGNLRIVTSTDIGLFGLDAPSGGSKIYSITRGTTMSANDVNINSYNGFGVKVTAATLVKSGHDFYINGSGNVGIGTTAPTSKLHIEQVQNSESLITLGNNRQDLVNVPIFGISAKNGGNDVAKISFYRASQSASGFITFSTKLDTASPLTEKLRINAEGNVSIGTTTPLLTGADRGNLTINGTSKAILTLGTGDAWKSYLYTDGTVTELYSSNVLAFGSGGANERMRITSTGNVGIGTTTPGNKLSVVTGAGANDTIPALGSNGGKFSLLNNGGLYGLISGVLGSGNSFLQTQRVDGTATAYDMLLQPNGGNVGIGTTNPTTKLHVTGITQIAESGNTAFYGGSYVRVFNDQNFNIRNAGGSTIANISVSGNSYFNGGNVGIGTTNPNLRLVVRHDIDGEGGVRIRNASSNIASTAMFRMNNDTGADDASQFLMFLNSSTRTVDGGVNTFTIRNNIGNIRISSASGGNVLFMTSTSDERMRITSSGNVGINTTNPTERLEINGNAKATTFIGALSGNATTATTLQTARTIAIGTAVTSTATSFNGSANITIPITGVSEAYLTWGGRNLAGSYGPIDAALMPDLGANRLAFTAPSAVIIEYSLDGGATWVNYGASDATKTNLLNGNSATIQVGGGGYPLGTDYTNYRVRVTINTAGQIYTVLNKFILLISTNGSTGSYCTVDARTQSNYLAGNDTWTIFSNQTPIAGWSGYNVINTNGLTTFGNTPASQFGQVRFTFGQTGFNTAYSGLQIIKLLGFGGVGWQTPSTLAATGRIYTYDHLRNVTFPASVSAVTFTGALSGNATTATTLQNARNINGTSFNGSASIETSYWGAVRTITIGNTGKTVNGSANVSWTLAEIGAQAALTNPITGTGTTNYLSKFTGGTALGNSQIFDNGTNVGIGTTSVASSRLTITGGSLPSQDNGNTNALQFSGGVTGRRASSNTVGFIGTYLNTSSIEISAGLSGAGISMHGSTASANANSLILYANSTESMRITSTGNVGIGTTSPGAKLDINSITAVSSSGQDVTRIGGLISFATVGSGPKLTFYRQDNGANLASIRGYTFGSLLAGLAFDTGYDALTTKMVIDNSGNVGIGTTSPSTILHTISANTIAQARFSSTGTGYAPASIILETSQSVNRGQGIYHYNSVSQETWFTGVPYLTDSKKWIVANNGSQATFDSATAQLQNSLLTIDSDTGNVGIGTTSPVTKLHIYGPNITTSSDTVAQSVLRLTRDITDPSFPDRKDSAVDFMLSRQQAASNNFPYTRFDIRLSGTTDSSTPTLDVMSLLYNGNVGIGTTAPTNKLHIVGDVYTTTGFVASGNSYMNSIGNTSTNNNANISLTSSGVRASRNVADSNTAFAVTQTNASSTGAIQTWNNSAGEVARVAQNGNVGIGTTSPSQKLSVSGNVSISNNNSLLLLDTVGNPGFQIRNTSSNIALIHQANNGSLRYRAGFSSNSGNAHIFAVGADTEIVRFTNDGNVGIGTSNPEVSLDVVGINGGTAQSRVRSTAGGDIRMSVDTVGRLGTYSNSDLAFLTNGSAKAIITAAGNVGIGTTSPQRQLQVGSFSGSPEICIGSGTTGTGAVVFGDGASGNDPWRGYVLYNHNDDALIFGAANGEKVRISSGGNLGIGTTSPSTKLYVREATQFSTAMTVQVNEDMIAGAGLIDFKNNAGSTIGSIYYNGFSTSYNTSSDYRLKENVVKIDGALDRLKLLKPVKFNFISRPDITVDGFIAHEVQEVIPEAIIGAKDELDKFGNPKYQGIDHSKIVPLLTAALQEAIDKITQLEERINKLENK